MVRGADDAFCRDAWANMGHVKRDTFAFFACRKFLILESRICRSKDLESSRC